MARDDVVEDADVLQGLCDPSINLSPTDLLDTEIPYQRFLNREALYSQFFSPTYTSIFVKNSRKGVFNENPTCFLRGISL